MTRWSILKTVIQPSFSDTRQWQTFKKKPKIRDKCIAVNPQTKDRYFQTSLFIQGISYNHEEKTKQYRSYTNTVYFRLAYS